VIYLDLDDLLHVAARTLGEAQVRDAGLLESALARPRTKAFGEDVSPSIHGKAAALLHSLARNHALVDGNERLALAGTIAFYGLNGVRLTLSNDEAYELVMAIAAGELDDVEPITARLPAGTSPGRRRSAPNVNLLAVAVLSPSAADVGGTSSRPISTGSRIGSQRNRARTSSGACASSRT
jgi:death-on-curing protein